MKCEACGAEEVMPFKCNYCGRYFCGEHRLPENHSCAELWIAKPPRESPILMPRRLVRRPFFQKYSSYLKPPRRILWFSQAEGLHLVGGIMLVLLVGLSLFWSRGGFRIPFWAITASAIIFALSFILHESAHKFTAQLNGLWAEFRLSSFGALLTLISIISPIKFIAPGAVVIAGVATSNIVGRVAVAGPLVNVALALAFLAAWLIIPFNTTVQSILWSGAYLNGFIAIFNLLPFGVLDGRKIFSWNKMVWLATVIGALIPIALTWIETA